jgi:hypothetical protein
MTNVNAALCPGASVAIEQVIVPVPPTVGVVHTKVGPLFCVSETNVVFAGTASEIVALAASDGPAFAIVSVYAMSEPASTAAGPLFVPPTSALTVTFAVVVALSFALFGSLVVVEMLAVLAMLLPVCADGVTCSTKVNVAVAPGASAAIEQAIVPVPPTAGFVQANVGPPVCVAETNVVLPGSVSVRLTLSADEAPAFVTVTV